MANNLAIKLPAFRHDAAEVWFAQADGQFAIKAVTVSKTKFYHAVAVLPQGVAAQILNLILSVSRSCSPSFRTCSPSDGFTASKLCHGVCHHLLTNPGPPVYAKPQRLDPEKLAAAKSEFSAMEKAGIIKHSSSPWSSRLHMMNKKEKGWRPCGDYRRLSNVTVPNRYPLPNIADFTLRIAGSTVFSRLDLQKRYYQIPMASEDVP